MSARIAVLVSDCNNQSASDWARRKATELAGCQRTMGSDSQKGEIMITNGDDYPLHQTPEPIAYTGGNRNFYDRYFFNGYNREGDVFFAAALGVYPYVNVMDAAFSVVVDGVQHNVYGSKVMYLERLDMSVGPVQVAVVEPLKTLKLLVNDTDNGIEADLTFTARTAAHEEPRFTRRSGSQLFMDVTRMMQNGYWSGWVKVKGKTIEVKPDQYWGTRDRSWGIRNIGAPDAQPNPMASDFQFYWLWAPLNFAEFGAHYLLNDDAEGKPWNRNAVVIPADGAGEMPLMEDHSCELEFVSGRRHAKSAVVKMHTAAGELWEFTFKPKWNFYMEGVGYGHKEWRHGSYHGELASGYDEWRVDDMPPEHLHIQAMCDIELTTPDKTVSGQGVLEQLIVGPHKPSGFKEMMDMAP